MEKRLSLIDDEISNIIKNNNEWKEKVEILQSAPGIGPVTSSAILVGIPEIGTLNRQKIAALTGLAPLNCDSGKFRGRRKIWGGRRNIRNSLYMATVVAIRFNPVIKAFYEHLIKQGKPFKVAITACMRKLITILNAMIKNGEKWAPQN